MSNTNSQRGLAPDLSPTPDSTTRTVLWWSRSGRDYSRDRIVRNTFRTLGWKIEDFRPSFSRTANLEAILRQVKRPDLVWVPCCRQQDVFAAQKWARERESPIVFDPLISAWDKQVFERQKFGENSYRARRLLKVESAMLRQSDIVVADTQAHAQLFCDVHKVNAENLVVIPVSAEEELFTEQEHQLNSSRPRLLFYGSFIGLQGPQHIAQAAREVPEADWTFIGSGPRLDECVRIAGDVKHMSFLPRVNYNDLPQQIGKADILLGIFGDSAKAGRVIPNKVYQSLACGRPVVTRHSSAYPAQIRKQPAIESGLSFADFASPGSIENIVRSLLKGGASEWHQQGRAARKTYASQFSNARVAESLIALLHRLTLSHSSPA